MQVISRALSVLATVCESPQGKSLTDISQALGLPMPTTHRLLKALITEGYVRREENTHRYFPGHSMLQVASAATSSGNLLDIVQPHLRDLVQTFDETVFVARIVNDRAVCVAAQTSSRPLHVQVNVGRDLPLHAAASARVLLAYRDVDEARRLLLGQDFQRYTEDTPRTVPEVLDHLEDIRRRGYDVCENELDANVWAVSSPVRSGNGVAAASLTVATPRERHRTAASRRAMTVAVAKHAEDMAAALPLIGAATQPVAVLGA